MTNRRISRRAFLRSALGTGTASNTRTYFSRRSTRTLAAASIRLMVVIFSSPLRPRYACALNVLIVLRARGQGTRKVQGPQNNLRRYIYGAGRRGKCTKTRPWGQRRPCSAGLVRTSERRPVRVKRPRTAGWDKDDHRSGARAWHEGIFATFCGGRICPHKNGRNAQKHSTKTAFLHRCDLTRDRARLHSLITPRALRAL